MGFMRFQVPSNRCGISMKESTRKPYMSPRLEREGTVRELTLGNVGDTQDPGAAGSYVDGGGRD